MEKMIFEQNENKWAWFSIDKRARFSIGETLGANPIICFGVRPSTDTPYNIHYACYKTTKNVN